MTRLRSAVSVLACVMLTGVPDARQAPPQQPQFEAAADLVEVEVSVRSAGQPVSGLTSADFQLTDNGVVQAIESLEIGSLPVDVSLLVDTSGATNGARNDPRPASRVRTAIANDVRLIRAMLRPGDRLRLVTVDTYARQVVGFRPIEEVPDDIASIEHDGFASLFDALAEALLQPVEVGRRHFVFARTRVVDTMSVLDAHAVRGLAARSNAVLHVVLDDESLLNENTQQDCQCQLEGLCTPTRRFWLPMPRRAPRAHLCGAPIPDALTSLLPRSPATVEILAEAAHTTGGDVHDAGLLLLPDLVDTFRSIFDTYRRGYVLRYVPVGVTRVGRHTIDVTVPGRPSFSIVARSGYWIDPPRPAPQPAATAAAPATPIDALARVFETRNQPAFMAAVAARGDVAALMREIRTSPGRWPDTPRLDMVFALELARVALTRDDPRANEEAARLLAHYHALVRHPLGPDEFECGWYWAGASALLGLVRPAVARPFIEKSLERCGDEPRLRLALAVATDQRVPFGSVESRAWQAARLPLTDAHRQEVRGLYEEAAQYPDVVAEARVRGAWLLLRAGDTGTALAWLDAASVPATDAYVGHLESLVRGHVYRAMGRLDDAAAAFRRALEIWPHAQSARVALMTLLVRMGQIDAAGDVASMVQTAPDDAWDPWWQYWQGDFRAYPIVLARLTEMAR